MTTTQRIPWWHSIDLGSSTTPGKKGPDLLAHEWAEMNLGDLSGQTVLDVGANDGYFSFCAERAGAKVTALDLWPDKRGFDLAKATLGSSVKEIQGDFMTLDLDPYDVVIFCGVLYHLTDPLGALRKLRSVTREVAIIETLATCIPEAPGRLLFEFFPGAEVNRDPTNWWAPTLSALEGATRAAGFGTFHSVAPEPEVPGHYRAMAKVHP